MLKKFNIRLQIIISVAFILGILLILQIFLYSLLHKENNNVVSNIFDSIAQSSAQQINKLNYDISEASVRLAVHPIVQANLYEYTPPEIVRNFSSIENLLTDYVSSNQNIAFLGILKDYSILISTETEEFYDYARNVVKDIASPKSSNPIFPSSFVFKDKTYFICVTPIFPTDISNRIPNHSGHFVVCIYEVGAISYMPTGVIDDSSIQLVVTDESDKVVLSSNPEEHGDTFNFSKSKHKNLLKTVKLTNPNWNVTVWMPSDNISIFSFPVVFFIFFMIFFTAIMLLLMLKLLNDIIVKRINLLKESVEKITDKDTNYRISYNFKDELSVVVLTINKVLDKVHSLNNEKIETLNSLYHAQLLQKETRIFYLYSQISPHFLYNSLSHIQGIALKSNVPQIATMISSLSKVYRYFSNNHAHSTIKMDLNCAIEYFNVINSKRKNPINLIYDVSPDLDSIKCLKMIFQPVLENTLKHAFKLDDTGSVSISSIPHDNKAIIEIKDDGVGIPADKLENIKAQLTEKDLDKIQNSEHIGLLNVNMRLKLYYNNDNGIEIYSEENRGTTVRIIFEKELPQTDL